MMSPRSFLVSRQTQLYPQNHRSSSGPSNAPRSTAPALSPQLSVVQKKDERASTEVPNSPSSSSDIRISPMPTKRKEAASKSPSLSPPKTTTTISRPTTPTTPVQIPSRPRSRDTAHASNAHRHHGERRRHHPQRPRDQHNPDAIPASVAALLAITSIPPPKSSRSLRQPRGAEKRMTVESIIERSQESEKELSLTLSKGPLDLLLTAPEDLEEDDLSICDSTLGSVLSTRTVSLESMPSLSESFSTDALSSLDSPLTPGVRRKARPTRRSLEPVSSPPGTVEPDHPLSSTEIPVESLDFRVFGEEEKEDLQDKKSSRLPFKPLKSAFKSNLTASLRALRQAAKSFSALNFPSIPPEDFLTRSILTLDPQVPYTDERRPQLEEEPTAAVRRYLNPTNSVRIEQPLAATPSPGGRAFTASIQMQTYKIHRVRGSSPSPVRTPYPPAGPSATTSRGVQQQRSLVTEYPMPGPRQREMRENSDFIRIAVMEMAMRKRGKLDDQQPGRARWALPPRKTSTKPYVIGDDGVPARWVPATY
ncbi:hypothetical protein QBC47DRAFT_72272 [Echria macrotheca]|uniref:Uncharacterized protein n=1 Tax=Echria macrotheca TaxID=438768 RepID=A0AAJ0B4N7_9PEZI|nr:hypothetical protein QBC47DRAFT_72272 [Echria macrotheca]